MCFTLLHKKSPLHSLKSQSPLKIKKGQRPTVQALPKTPAYRRAGWKNAEHLEQSETQPTSTDSVQLLQQPKDCVCAVPCVHCLEPVTHCLPAGFPPWHGQVAAWTLKNQKVFCVHPSNANVEWFNSSRGYTKRLKRQGLNSSPPQA